MSQDRFSDPPAALGLEAEVDEFAAKELAAQVSNISIEEREAAMHDIHGVTPSEEESSEALERSFVEMNKSLSAKIHWRHAC